MKHVVVTGASTGIGYATVEYLLQKGYFVFGSVRNTTDAQRLAQQFGQQFAPLIFDVCDQEAIQKAAQEVALHIGSAGLAALVNNAGVAVAGPLQHVPIQQLEKQFDINVLGVMRVTQAFLPLLGAQQPTPAFSPGRIVNISSVSGRITNAFVAPYSASKHALESLSDGLRRELFMYNIRVSVIQPGPIKTPIWGKALHTGDQYQHTAYGAIMSNINKFVSKAEESAIPPEQVAKSIYHALSAPKPKIRYVVADKPYLHKLFFLMPDKVMDYLTKRMLKKYMP